VERNSKVVPIIMYMRECTQVKNHTNAISASVHLLQVATERSTIGVTCKGSYITAKLMGVANPILDMPICLFTP